MPIMTPASAPPIIGDSWTKRQFVLEAFTELGLAGYEFDLSPDMLNTGLRRLDSMMARWFAQYGFSVGYPLPVPADSDLDDATTVPFSDNEAIWRNLAVALAPSYGKTLSRDTTTGASVALRALLTKYATTPTKAVDYTMVPAGAGYKTPSTSTGNPFLPQEAE